LVLLCKEISAYVKGNCFKSLRKWLNLSRNGPNLSKKVAKFFIFGQLLPQQRIIWAIIGPKRNKKGPKALKRASGPIRVVLVEVVKYSKEVKCPLN
jgi:hypothetical protein